MAETKKKDTDKPDEAEILETSAPAKDVKLVTHVAAPKRETSDTAEIEESPKDKTEQIAMTQDVESVHVGNYNLHRHGRLKRLKAGKSYTLPAAVVAVLVDAKKGVRPGAPDNDDD